MTYALIDDLAQRLDGLRADGLYKTERIITSPQGGVVYTDTGEMINLCANNYLGLSGHPALAEAGRAALEK